MAMEWKCEQCKSKFSAAGRKPRRFCSADCYHASQIGSVRGAYKTPRPKTAPRIVKPCYACGADVERRATDMREHVFCNSTCYHRWLSDRPSRGRPRHPVGSRRAGADGYVLVQTDDGWRAEHRVVMEQVIRRALRDDENVHHKNGVKNDNRAKNLELWVTHQPKGCRVDDVVVHAVEMLRRYAPHMLVQVTF